MFLYKKLTEKIIKAFYEVHNILGSGYLETIYKNALLIEAEFHPSHKAQVISYLKATGLKVAFLVNFGKQKVAYFFL